MKPLRYIVRSKIATFKQFQICGSYFKMKFDTKYIPCILEIIYRYAMHLSSQISKPQLFRENTTINILVRNTKKKYIYVFVTI